MYCRSEGCSPYVETSEDAAAVLSAGVVTKVEILVEAGLIRNLQQYKSFQTAKSTMYYVYIIRSMSFPEQIYIGYTLNLKNRLAYHNSGHVPHTSKYKPWEVISFVAFNEKMKAINFEIYLKSGSGKEFLKKRLI